MVGLGRLGGGVDTAKFLLSQGAKVVVTDLKDARDLSESLKALKGLPLKFTLGGHKESDFRKADLIIFNPAVSIFSPWVKLARKLGKPYENDFTLFLRVLSDQGLDFDYVGVTGTRGKTTVATWVAHLLGQALLGGNILGSGLSKIVGKVKKSQLVVLELSSYQLEFLRSGLRAPKIAIITNFSPDHLNRYGSLDRYAGVKAKIFLNQKVGDHLILNADDPKTKWFLKRKSQGRVWLVSLKNIDLRDSGLFMKGESIYYADGSIRQKISSIKNLSQHQKSNLLFSLLAARLCGRKWSDLTRRISSLPKIPFRQEVIIKKRDFLVINDTSATSPQGTLAAIERFRRYSPHLALIVGGTDKNLSFTDLVFGIRKTIRPENLFLINGSATKKIIKELESLGYFKKDPQVFENLTDLVRRLALRKREFEVILFSPACASFEKFKNEYDRGRQFTNLAKRFLK